MSYSSEMFKNCSFSPFEEYPLKVYPNLKKMVVKDKYDPDEDELHVSLPENKVIRYILALYDPKSPLIKGEQNLMRRKEIAAEIAGFDMEKDDVMLAILFEYKYDHVVEMVQNFLKDFVKSMDWALLVSLEQTFWEFQGRLMQPIDRADKDKDLMSAVQTKTKMATDIADIQEKYKTALSKFYGDEEVLIEATTKIRRFTPEGVAKFARGHVQKV